LYILLTLALTLGVSLGIAWAWQNIENGRFAIFASAPAAQPPPETPAASIAGSAHISPVFAPQLHPSQVVREPRERPDFPYALPQTAMRAQRSSFRGAVFLGDSMVDAISFYLPLDNIYHSEPDKIYIMFGADSLPLDPEALIDTVKLRYPNATIFALSMPPVTRTSAHSNDSIDEYNLALMQLARDKRIHFLDVNSALLDDYGYLPESFAPADGVHLSAEAYYIWFEYLRWHTINQ